MGTKVKKWNVLEYLKTEDDMIGYFDACLRENDAALIVAALGDIARALSMLRAVRIPSKPDQSLEP